MSLVEARPHKQLYNKVIEFLNNKDIYYKTLSNKTGLRFIQGDGDSATCIELISNGANDKEIITVSYYYKDTAGKLRNNIIDSSNDFNKIKKALLVNPRFDGYPVNINLK